MAVNLADFINRNIKDNPNFLELFKNTVNEIYGCLLRTSTIGEREIEEKYTKVLAHTIEKTTANLTRDFEKTTANLTREIENLSRELANKDKEFELRMAKLNSDAELKITRMVCDYESKRKDHEFEFHKRYELLEKHYLILQQEKQTIAGDLEVLKPMADVCNRFLKNKQTVARSAAEIGAEGEETIMEMFANNAFSGAKITRISVSVDHCCDLLFERGDLVCLIEVKRYSKAIPLAQLEKFRSDIRLRNQTDGINCGIFISIGEERMGPYIRSAVEFTDKTVMFYSYLDSLEGLITLINHAGSVSNWMKSKSGNQDDYIETIRGYYQSMKSRVGVLADLIAQTHGLLQSYGNEKKELEVRLSELTTKYCYLEKQIETHKQVDEQQFITLAGLVEKNHFTERIQLINWLKSIFPEYDQYIFKRAHKVVMQVCCKEQTVQQCLELGKQLNMTSLSTCISWNKNAYQLLRKIDDHAAENIKQYAKDLIS